MMDIDNINEKDLQEILISIGVRNYTKEQLEIIVAALLTVITKNNVDEAKDLLELYKF